MKSSTLINSAAQLSDLCVTVAEIERLRIEYATDREMINALVRDSAAARMRLAAIVAELAREVAE